MYRQKPHMDADAGGLCLLKAMGPRRAQGAALHSQDLAPLFGWNRRWGVRCWLHMGLAMVLLLLLAGGTSVAARPSGGGPIGAHGYGLNGYLATFRKAPCPFRLGAGIVEGQQVICGYVAVPENRNVNDGQKVQLAVAIYRAPQYMHSVDPSPVLRLEGGPGISDLSGGMVEITAANYSKWVFNHNLIFFDQRGIGYSTPSLDCFGQPPRACYDRLVFSGINLNNFNTLANAADVRDLIHALGYQKMTLYGVSYGARLALTVVRLYPEVVRALVLDSVYPPNHNRDELAAAAQRAFTTLFQGCAADPACRARYPDLQSVFASEVKQLNAHPISFNLLIRGASSAQPIKALTGDQWVSLLYDALYYTSMLPVLPKAIADMPRLIAQIQQHITDWLIDPYPPSMQFQAGTLNFGVFYSIECSEDWPYLTQQDITNSLQGVTPPIARAIGAREQAEYNVCQFWKVQPLPPVQKQPVVSNIPALVLAGGYDPITPPSDGEEVASYLSHSYFFRFPGVGHEVQYNSSCADRIISAFEDDPTREPDSSCIAHMSGPVFI